MADEANEIINSRMYYVVVPGGRIYICIYRRTVVYSIWYSYLILLHYVRMAILEYVWLAYLPSIGITSKVAYRLRR